MTAAVQPENPDSVDRHEMIRRAGALIPVLNERAERCEEARQMLPETEQDFHQNGLFRIHQPARVGGYELDIGMFVDLGAEIARGCPSSSWNLLNLGSHHWMLGLWPEQAQTELWSESLDVLIASSLIFPAGKAEKVDGGYIVNGRWPFCSGIDNSTWIMIGAFETAPGDDSLGRLFLVPDADYTIIDTWHSTGLKGTGSKDILCENIFVPDYKSVSVEEIKRGDAPGTAINTQPLYRLPPFAMLPYVLAGVGLGAAQGALEEYLTVTKTRVASYTGAKLSDQQVLQVSIADASAMIDAAQLVLRRNCDDAMERAYANKRPETAINARYLRDAAYATGLCRSAVNKLIEISGAGALYSKSPMQRYFRDIQAIGSHAGFNMNIVGANYGRITLGHPSNNPNIVTGG